MVAGWMLYGVLVAALLLAAGLLLEEAGKRVILPLRGVWLAMLTGSVLVPVLAALRPAEPRADAMPVGADIGGMGPLLLDPLRLVMPVESPLVAYLSTALLVGWGLASLCLLGMGALAALRLRRARRGWRLVRSVAPRLYLADDAGPAVVGVLRAAIVLPAWSAPRDRRLMLTHEAEHVRAGDPLLLLFTHLLVALLPWNLPLWWQLRRLRLAVEVDCDARVLRRKPDLRSYASLLLDVGERRSGLQPVLVAFAEPVSFLERRIRIMVSDRRRKGWMISLALASVAGALLLVACSADAPTDGLEDERPAASDDRGPVDVYQSVPDSGLPVVVIDTGPPPPPPPVEREDPPPPPPPQPAREAEAGGDAVEFAYESHVLDRQPELRNLSEISSQMARGYPRALQDAGVGGNVTLQFVVGADGVVEEQSIRMIESSHEQFVDISTNIAKRFVFRPGMYEGRAVRTLVMMPITWQPAR